MAFNPPRNRNPFGPAPTMGPPEPSEMDPYGTINPRGFDPNSSVARDNAMMDYWNQHPDQRLANDLNPSLAKATQLRQAMAALNGDGGSAGGAFGVGGRSGGGVGDSGGGGGYLLNDSTAAPVPGVEAPDMTAANAATFGHAKDSAGRTGRASLQSLRDELGSSGMLGSGAEAQGVRDITAGTQGQLGEVSRSNAMNESAQNADFAKMRYQGGITQRGQDIQHQEAQARLALQRELAMQQMLQAALAGLTGGGSGGGGPMPSGGGGGAAY